MRKLYPLWKQSLINGDANAALNGTVRAALVDGSLYTYSDAHQFFTSVSEAVVGTPQDLNNKTYVNGLFGADVSTNFHSVAAGPTVGAIVVYVWTGTAGTSRLVLFFDDISGLPIVPDGGDLTIQWDAAGILQL